MVHSDVSCSQERRVVVERIGSEAVPSDQLIAPSAHPQVHEHATIPENALHWSWSVGDLVVWDDRQTLRRRRRLRRSASDRATPHDLGRRSRRRRRSS